MSDASEVPVEGVRGLEHTADVALEVEAPTLPELFRRGALGAMWLVLDREGKEESESGLPNDRRPLDLVEEDLPALFRAWLRTLLFWEETEGFVTRDASLSFAPVPLCTAPDGQGFGLEARIAGFIDKGSRVREIKGVTLHGLSVIRKGEGWVARVIFDV
jgi:SHS2 domain-containing protein